MKKFRVEYKFAERNWEDVEAETEEEAREEIQRLYVDVDIIDVRELETVK
jgi:hypothetical protein